MTAEIEMYEPRAPPLPIRELHAETTEAKNPASTLIPEEDPTHIPPLSPADKESSLHCTELDLSPENAKQGSLLAVQALQSLERICAAFSSDSLGSLEMTDPGTDYAEGSQSEFDDLNERNPNVPPTSPSTLSHICKAPLDLECSMASDTSLCEDVNFSVNEDLPASDPLPVPRPLTPIVKCSTWASSIPRQHISSTSAASSSSSSSSESILIPATVCNKKSPKFCYDKPDGSPTPTRMPILASFKPSSTYPTDRFVKPVKDTFYTAVPPPQMQNPKNNSQQPLPPSQNKPSTVSNVLDQKYVSPALSPCKPRSNTINTVSPLPPTLSTPRPETLSTISPFKPRSNTVNMDSPKPSTRRNPRPERPIPSIKPRSNTIAATLLVSQSHTAKTISSSAKRRSNTLDSYMQIPSKIAKSAAKTEAVSSEDDITAPTAAFMRRPDLKTTPVNTCRLTNSVVPLIPNWSPTLNSDDLSPTQYRNMLRGGVNMVVR